jgi:ribose transport system permease protein
MNGVAHEAAAARVSVSEILRRYNVLATLAILVLFATVSTRGLFLDVQNLINIGERASVVGIVGLGQMLVILTGGIDLSVGGIMALSLVVVSAAGHAGLPGILIIVLAVLTGMAAGLVNGILVSRTRVPPFMVTLGTMLFSFSLATFLTGASQLEYHELQRYINGSLGLTKLGERLLPTGAWLVLSALLILVLARTRFGHNVYAVGGKELAARLSGIRTGAVKLMVYVASGLFSSVAAMVLAYRLSASNPDIGTAALLESIAAVVCGGTNVNGGEGSIYGTLVGAIVMAALVNLLNLLNANPYIQDAIKGLMLVAFVVFLQAISKRR